MLEQINLQEMQNDIQEIKLGLLEILKEKNPIAYLKFLGKIKNAGQVADNKN